MVFFSRFVKCEKCGIRMYRLRLLSCLLGRQSYVCPQCGNICSFCVEKYERAVPTCKYCGSEVVIK